MNLDEQKAYARGYSAGRAALENTCSMRMDPQGRTFDEFVRAQVAWYRENGAYPHRIKVGGDGKEYVIGDESWNAKGRGFERIEGVMAKVGL